MLNRQSTISALAGAALLSFSVGPAMAEAEGNEEYVFADDLTEPLPKKKDELVKLPVAKAQHHKGEPGAIEGSLEERYAKFQAEQEKRVKHFQDVVNRNHMRKYGVKVR